MSTVVQANCPHCRRAIRVPSVWLDRTMRCKFCKNVFQGQGDGTAVAAGAPAPRTAGDPFSFDDDSHHDTPLSIASPHAGKKRSSAPVLLIAGLVLAVGLVGVLGVGVVAWRLLGGGGGAELIEDGGPVADNPPDKGSKPAVAVPVGRDAGGFPRRALLISVNNYLMFNTLHYGSKRDTSYPGSSTRVLMDQLQRPPMYMPEKQVVELSDSAEAKTPHPTQKAVIETTIKDFCETCRPQDRVLLVFAGHACDIEKDSYLIPIEGVKDDPATLIPLKWVYDQLAACKAQQKILVLDVFRYSPSRGFELPGAGEGEKGEMGEVFDENLKTPPAGVQVWSSCVKGQASIEGENGSFFFQALNHALQQRGGTGISDAKDPLPIDDLVARVNKRLKELAAAEKMEQTSRLTGTAPAEVPYDPQEPAAAPIALKPPPAPPGGSAGHAQVDRILDEIKLLPPVRETRAGETSLLKAANLPPFKADVLKEYRADEYKLITDAVARYQKDPDQYAKQYPLRAAVFDAVKALEESNKVKTRESLLGPITPQKKAEILKEQQDPGLMIFELEKVLGLMTALEEEREKEKSKRWQANFDYARARLQSRLVYLFESSYVLAQIRAESLPDLGPGQTGWRIGSRKKIQVNESKAKQYAKDVSKAWKKIDEEYPDTPWALLAKRENLIALGLEWRAKSD